MLIYLMYICIMFFLICNNTWSRLAPVAMYTIIPVAMTVITIGTDMNNVYVLRGHEVLRYSHM